MQCTNYASLLYKTQKPQKLVEQSSKLRSLRSIQKLHPIIFCMRFQHNQWYLPNLRFLLYLPNFSHCNYSEIRFLLSLKITENSKSEPIQIYINHNKKSTERPISDSLFTFMHGLTESSLIFTLTKFTSILQIRNLENHLIYCLVLISSYINKFLKINLENTKRVICLWVSRSGYSFAIDGCHTHQSTRISTNLKVCFLSKGIYLFEKQNFYIRTKFSTFFKFVR